MVGIVLYFDPWRSNESGRRRETNGWDWSSRTRLWLVWPLPRFFRKNRGREIGEIEAVAGLWWRGETQEPLGQQKKHGVSLASHVSHYLAVVLLLLSLMPPSTLASSCSPFTVSNCTFPQEDIINQFTLPDIDGADKQVFQNHVNTLSAFLDPNLYALVQIAGQFF